MTEHHHQPDGGGEDYPFPEWLTRTADGNLEFGIPEGFEGLPLADVFEGSVLEIGAAIDLLTAAYAGKLSAGLADFNPDIDFPPGGLVVGDEEHPAIMVPADGGYYRFPECVEEDRCVHAACGGDDGCGGHPNNRLYAGQFCLMIWAEGCDYRFVADPRRVVPPTATERPKPGRLGRIVPSAEIPEGANVIGEVRLDDRLAERLTAVPGGMLLFERMTEEADLTLFQLVERIAAAKAGKRKKLLRKWDALAEAETDKPRPLPADKQDIGGIDRALFWRLRETPGGYEAAVRSSGPQSDRLMVAVIRSRPGRERDDALAAWDEYVASRIGLTADAVPDASLLEGPGCGTCSGGLPEGEGQDRTAIVKCSGCSRFAWFWEALPHGQDLHPEPPLDPDCPRRDVPFYPDMFVRCVCGKFVPPPWSKQIG